MGDLDTTLLHHLGEITIADAIFAAPADVYQDDLDPKAATLEHGHGGGPLTNHLSLYGRS
jgi:hypothetical protein